MTLTLEQTVALAYASDAMARESDRLRAAGLREAADLIDVERRVIDDLRRGDPA